MRSTLRGLKKRFYIKWGNIRSLLESQLKILFLLKLQSEDWFGILSPETSYLKLFSWVVNQNNLSFSKWLWFPDKSWIFLSYKRNIKNHCFMILHDFRQQHFSKLENFFSERQKVVEMLQYFELQHPWEKCFLLRLQLVLCVCYYYMMNAWVNLILLEFTTIVSVWINNRMNIIIHKGNFGSFWSLYHIGFKITFHLPDIS